MHSAVRDLLGVCVSLQIGFHTFSCTCVYVFLFLLKEFRSSERFVDLLMISISKRMPQFVIIVLWLMFYIYIPVAPVYMCTFP